MPKPSEIANIVPKKYRNAVNLFEYTSLDDLEARLRVLNYQRSTAWFIEALAIYGIIWDGELYAASGLSWPEYKASIGKRLGLSKVEFYDYFQAGKFLMHHGKLLFAAGFDPTRSVRKLARASVALKICGKADQVIDHLVNDQWEEFKAWYTGLRDLAIAGPVRRKRSHEVIVRKGKVFVDGREPVQFAEDVPEQEKKDIAKLVRDYYLMKER